MPVDVQLKEAEARVGRLLHNKWRLDELLGVGGMASVYAATHRNGKRGAVKLLHPELGRIEEAKVRFLREGYVANSVGHPGAVSVLDDDITEDGLVFLVMELLEGTTVDRLAEEREGHRLELSTVLQIADELLDILIAAHQKGIVHRDIKPENLFLTRDARLHVLDFGIARLREKTSAVTTTQAGATMGTPAFMPPEQALGEWEQVDARTDLWAVGATIYTLLTGRFVHEADTLQKMMLAAMTRPAPSLGILAPDLPAAVIQLVDRALQAKREDRYQSAELMQAAVRACQRLLPTTQDTRTLPSRRAAQAEPHKLQVAEPAVEGPSERKTLSTPGLAIESRPPRALRITADPVSSDPANVPLRRSRFVYLAVPAGLALLAVVLIARLVLPAKDKTAAAPTSGPVAESAPVEAVSSQPIISVVPSAAPSNPVVVASSEVVSSEASGSVSVSVPAPLSARPSASARTVLPKALTQLEPVAPSSPPARDGGTSTATTSTPSPLFTSRKQ